MDQIELLHIATHPTRWGILNSLKGEPSYVSRLAEELDVDRKKIEFHCRTLEEAGLVTAEYGLRDATKNDSIPRAVKYYSLTEQGKDTIKDLMPLVK